MAVHWVKEVAQCLTHFIGHNLMASSKSRQFFSGGRWLLWIEHGACICESDGQITLAVYFQWYSSFLQELF